MFGAEACEISRTDLADGDTLVLYTDGITEAENPRRRRIWDGTSVGPDSRRRSYAVSGRADEPHP